VSASAVKQAGRSGHVELPDGRRLEFDIRPSPRSKSVRLKLSAREGLVVVVPAGLSAPRVQALVAARADWIAAKLAGFDKVRHLLSTVSPTRPEAFDLPALGESWRIEYRTTKATTVGARTDQQGRVVIFGAVDDIASCHAALRRWLARRAKDALIPWLDRVSNDTGLSYADVAIKGQRTRWGSCTARGRISLNNKLLFLPRELVRYVLVHELCHMVEHSHSKRFWATVQQYEPRTDVLHEEIRDAWKYVPSWAAHRADVSR